MIPEVLSENVASLHPGVDRLAVSVLWTMTPPPECKVVDVWYGRTVINSSGAVPYELAQQLVDGVPSSKVAVGSRCRLTLQPGVDPEVIRYVT